VALGGPVPVVGGRADIGKVAEVGFRLKHFALSMGVMGK